jgi:hypothetical protein
MKEREIERVCVLVCEKGREGGREGGRDCVVCVRVQGPLKMNNSVQGPLVEVLRVKV